MRLAQVYVLPFVIFLSEIERKNMRWANCILFPLIAISFWMMIRMRWCRGRARQETLRKSLRIEMSFELVELRLESKNTDEVKIARYGNTVVTRVANYILEMAVSNRKNQNSSLKLNCSRIVSINFKMNFMPRTFFIETCRDHSFFTLAETLNYLITVSPKKAFSKFKLFYEMCKIRGVHKKYFELSFE